MGKVTPSTQWTAIVESISSERIKDRTDALAQIRPFLSIKRNFTYINEDDTHSWGSTLQTLFEVVRAEQNGVHRVKGKSGVAPPASVKRLEEAAGIVRFLVDKLCDQLSKKAVKGLFKHLTQMICVSGGRLPAYALTYLRALRTLLNHAPHLEHLDERTWTDVVTLCFAAALGDPIKIGQEFMEAEMMQEDAEEEDQLGQIGGKRGERLRSALQRGQVNEHEAAPRRTATQEDIELLGCIDAAFKCTSAPLISLAVAILSKFMRFFQQFQVETTAHLPALTALNRTFAALELNNVAAMTLYGAQLWPHIIALWTTKNTAHLKEQVVIALQYLLPFVAPRDIASPAIQEQVTLLYQTLLDEPLIRWRGEALSMDSLRLGLDENSEDKCFSLTTFRYGSSFSGMQAMAWGIIELGADVLAKTYVISEKIQAAKEDESPSKKRRKIEEPLSELINSLHSEVPLNSLLFRLQLFLFLIERHWSLLHLDVQQQLFETLGQLVNHGDAQVECWTLLALGSIALHSPPRFESTLEWEQLWSTTMRKLAHPAVSRSAAHTANLLLSSHRIDSTIISTSIEGLARDLDVQGPHFPSDAVCHFLCTCLRLAVNDVKLFRLGLPAKVLAWLSTGWKPLEGINKPFNIGQAKPRADPLNGADLCALVFRICGLDKVAQVKTDFALPDSPISIMMVARKESEVLRHFLLDARLPDYSSRATNCSTHPPGPGLTSDPTLQRKVSLWMDKVLTDLQEETALGGAVFWATLSVEKARRLLDFTVMAMVIEGSFEINDIPASRTTLKAAGLLLAELIPVLNFKKWSLFERAFALAGLSPLVINIPEYQPVQYVTLLDPGPASSVARHVLRSAASARHAPHLRRVDFSSTESTLLAAIWNSHTTRDTLIQLSECLVLLLTGSHVTPALAPMSPSQSLSSTQVQRRREREARIKDDDDDDFGEIRVAEAPQLGKSKSAYTDLASDACASICVRGLISAAMMDSPALEAVRVPQVLEAILESDGEVAIVIAENVFTAVSAGAMKLSLEDQDRILSCFGEELLPDYRFAADERFALAGLRFLECTAMTWIMATPEQVAGDFARKARVLCGWYAGRIAREGINSWRVRLKLLDFLDYYLSIDVSQEQWQAAVTESVFPAPTAIIPGRLGDKDLRVRFRAATSAAALFTFMQVNIMPEQNRTALLADINDHLTNDSSRFEEFLTRVLCFANLVVADSTRRRAAYEYLVRTAGDDVAYCTHIESALRGVALKLGLPRLSDLYISMSRFIAWRSIQFHVLDAKLPPAVCGFGDLHDMVEATFKQVGSLYLSRDLREEFEVVCRILQCSQEQGALSCLADATALAVCSYFELPAHANAALPHGVLAAQLQSFCVAARAGDAEEASKWVASVADQVVTSIALLSFSPLWTDAELSGLTGEQATIFNAIRHQSDRLVHFEPPPPFFKPLQIIKALDWFTRQYPLALSPAAIYSTLHNLFTAVQSAPSVNNQERYLASIALVIAVAGDSALDATVLGLLAESLVILLPLVDLIEPLARMLQWTLTQWSTVTRAEDQVGSRPELCANLLRAAHACHAVGLVALEDADTNTTEVASELANWLSKCVEALKDIEFDLFMQVGLLWPTPLIPGAADHFATIQHSIVSSFSPICKFGLVKPLQLRPNSNVGPEGLWRLLASLPRHQTPDLDECVAFADLVYRASGRVSRPSLEEVYQLEMVKPEDAHELETLPVSGEVGIKAIVVSKLLDSLRLPNLQLVHLASNTIRNLVVVAPTLVLDFAAPRSQGIYNHLSVGELARDYTARVARAHELGELITNEAYINGDGDYDVWIRRVTQFLADYRSGQDHEPFYAQLVPVLQESTEIAGALFPQLVHSILHAAIERDDEQDEQALSGYFTRLLHHPTTSRACIHALVNLVIYLRIHQQPNAATPLSCDQWLTVPWILLAEAAVQTRAHLTALLFLELGSIYDGSSDNSDSDTTARRQAILYDVYAQIDEVDGFYGQQSPDVRQALIRRYHHEQRWSNAFQLHGADFESAAAGAGATLGVLKSLSSFGFNRLASVLLTPSLGERAIASEDLPVGLAYDLAWKTDSWDLPVQVAATGTSSVALYSALRSVHVGRNASRSRAMVESALLSETAKLSSVSLDLPIPHCEAISTLLALREVRHWTGMDTSSGLAAELIAQLTELPDTFQFSHAERILSTRISLLRSIRVRERADQISDIPSAIHTRAAATERACYIRLSELARNAGHLQIAMNAIILAQDLVEEVQDENVEEEFANVLWSQGEHKTAIELLEALACTPKRRPAVLARLGTWTAVARLKNPTDILVTYFEPSTAALGISDSPGDRSRVYHAFATFADDQYQVTQKTVMEERAKIASYTERIAAQETEFEQEKAAELVNTLLLTQLQRGLSDGKGALLEDQSRLAKTEQVASVMLRHALTNYAQALIASDTVDEDLFRFSSLWLAHAGDDDLNRDIIAGSLPNITSHKFIFLFHQLSARLQKTSREDSSFDKAVKSLVLRICCEHPFHSLYQINALCLAAPSALGSVESSPSNSGRSKRRDSAASVASSATSARAESPSDVQRVPRAVAAQIILTKVSKTKVKLKARVAAIGKVCEAYLEWADYNIATQWHAIHPTSRSGKLSTGTYKIPSGLKILALKDIDVPIPSHDLPIDVRTLYESNSYPGIVQFSPKFTYPGGVTYPKIVHCIGTDRKTYTSLLKGKDDPRQDTVMEQAFKLINDQLNLDERTRSRKLRIRTYKIVPLSPTAANIEYIKETASLAETITAAYSEFQPELIPTLNSARTRLAQCEQMSGAERRGRQLQTLASILQDLPPVYRHVAFQRHKSPTLWFDYRLCYARSVATSSIVGWIFGVGDRHPSNILVDKVTGELVHIDMGIAFEQGKKLRIPETVPFRLTANIVDGMGMAGVNGVFRRCAEETLRVVRERSNVVMTVLEVFKHDPLQNWVVSVDLARRVQGEEAGNSNISALPDDADRALSVVAGKLSKELSVEHMVNQLIVEATDLENLSRIYSGWKGYV